jgi:hypothetical protein
MGGWNKGRKREGNRRGSGAFPPDKGKENVLRSKVKKEGICADQGKVLVYFRARQKRRRKSKSHSGQLSRECQEERRWGRRTS